MTLFPRLYEILIPMSKYYRLKRRPHVSPWGMLKYWEVTPIVAVVMFEFISISLYFTLYYPLSRGECLYTRTPGYRKIDLEKPSQWKFIDFVDYKTYKPLREIKSALHDMKCEEYRRLEECKSNGVETDFKMDEPTDC